FFSNIPAIMKKLQTLNDVGLGYLRLGQPATTLSGGEAQRIKLAAELSRRDTGKTVYILDEPTTGLHFADVSKLLNVLKRLVDLGNTIIIIEHDPEIGWKTGRLVSKIADIEFVVTDNEIEAFLLESNLIKRYRPVFNIELKDQQRYTYLKITDEPFPRLLVARRNRNGEFLGPMGRVYGPFVRGSSKFLTVGLLRKLFKIRICNRLPKTPCLQYFIKNCDAPCIAKVTRGDYMANVVAL